MPHAQPTIAAGATHSALAASHCAPLRPARSRDYFALLKPRVMSLVVFTALVGMVVAPSGTCIRCIAFASLLVIAVGAGASGCLNMWCDADIDALMTRTRTRPDPGRPGHAATRRWPSA